MSIEKSTAWNAEPGSIRRKTKPEDGTPAEDVRILSLELEEEDAGGDPYNHTGQLYSQKLRKRER